jgi:hypothetical protein
MRLTRRLPLLGVTALCASVSCILGTPDEPAPLDVTGTWRFTEDLADSLRGVSCSDTGQYVLMQVRDQFEGTYTQTGVCRTPQGLFGNRQTGPVTAGRVVGMKVQFHVSLNCDYAGSLDGAPPSGVAGTGYCIVRDSTGRTVYNYTGPWKAIR